MSVPILAKLIHENANTIVDRWLEKVRQAKEFSRQTPFVLLKNYLWDAVEGIVQIQEADQHDLLYRFSERLVRDRATLYLFLTEIHILFLVGEDTITDLLNQEVKDRESLSLYLRQVDHCFHEAIYNYVDLYQKAQLDQVKSRQAFLERHRQALINLSTVTTRSESLKELLSGSLEVILNFMNLTVGDIFLYHPNTDEIIIEVHKNIPPKLLERIKIQKLGMNEVGVASRTATERHPILIEDLIESPLAAYALEAVREARLKTLAAYPLLAGSDLVGVLQVISSEERKFSSDDLSLLSLMSDQLAYSIKKNQIEEQIISQERYLSNILNDSADAIIGLDVYDTITAWNRGAERIFGYSREEMMGHSLEILLPLEAKETDELNFIRESAIRYGYLKDFEAERITKDGRRIYISLTRTALRDKNGKLSGFSAVIRDTSEMKKLQQQISHAEKLSVVGKLAAGIAHEVGNPLTSIASLVQVILRKESDHSKREKLDLIRSQVSRITKIIRELVDFSRPSTNERKLTNVNDVIDNAVRIVKYDKKSAGINFTLDLHQPTPQALVVPDQLFQVYLNILINAVDAIEKKPGEISVRSELKDNALYCHIADTGIGISPDLLPRIFEPFFTTKEVGKGTGLGLWVSYSIIKNLGGDILVDTAPGRGTTFSILLPLSVPG